MTDTAGTESDRSMDEQQLVDERIEELLASHPPADTDDVDFWGAQYDLGLAWVQFPEGKGGIGVSPRFQKRVNDRIQEAGASTENRSRNLLGIGMGAGTLVAHGTPEQQDRWLRPMFTNEELWCQLFSEPGAGSDLAALSSSATREGDEWVVNGQKVWTTLAQRARWGMLVTRTDPDVPKHAGLTYFIVDMEADGVDVRPLYQITGEAEFNEVYFDDVRIPDDQRVGEVGQGWTVAMATLMNERVAIGATVVPRGSGAIGQAVETWQERDLDDPVARDMLTRHWIAAEAQRLTTARAAATRQRGIPGPEGSTAKLQWAELNKAITSFTMDLLGHDGLLYPDGYERKRPEQGGTRTPSRQKAFLRARANSIEGGTSEILKNILGERVLGLPGEPRVDKNIPWKDVPRS